LARLKPLPAKRNPLTRHAGRMSEASSAVAEDNEAGYAFG